MELLRGLNKMMCISCVWAWRGLCSQKGGHHSSIQAGPLESGVRRRQAAGSKWGWRDVQESQGLPRSHRPPFALRDLSPPEPLSVPDPGLPELPYHTPSCGCRRIPGPSHSSHQAKGQGDNPRLQEQISDPSPAHCVALGSVIPRFLSLSNRANAICLIQMGMKSDEVMQVKYVCTGKGFGSMS